MTGKRDDDNTAETADMLQLMRTCGIDPAIPLRHAAGAGVREGAEETSLAA